MDDHNVNIFLYSSLEGVVYFPSALTVAPKWRAPRRLSRPTAEESLCKLSVYLELRLITRFIIPALPAAKLIFKRLPGPVSHQSR